MAVVEIFAAACIGQTASFALTFAAGFAVSLVAFQNVAAFAFPVLAFCYFAQPLFPFFQIQFSFQQL